MLETGRKRTVVLSSLRKTHLVAFWVHMLLVYCLMYSGKIQTLLSRPSVVSCGQYPRVSEKRIRPLPRMKDKYDGWVLLAQIVSFIMQLFEASRFPNTREENCLARSLGARDTMWETHCPSVLWQNRSFHSMGAGRTHWVEVVPTPDSVCISVYPIAHQKNEFMKRWRVPKWELIYKQHLSHLVDVWMVQAVVG